MFARSLGIARQANRAVSGLNSMAAVDLKSTTLSFASPESDFVASSATENDPLATDTARTSALIFSGPWLALGSVLAAPSAPLASQVMLALPPLAIGALAVSRQWSLFKERSRAEEAVEAMSAAADFEPLPTTLAQVLLADAIAETLDQAPSHPVSQQAIVITRSTAPFPIVHVNKAWEELCGFTLAEVQGETLGMLQQPGLTQRPLVDAMLAKLTQHNGRESAAHTLRNITKGGKAFDNYLRVAPLEDKGLFVGSLQDVTVARALA